MKTSVIDALKRAQLLSMEFPGLTVRVMDKARKRAVVNVSEWVYEELILDDYVVVATFKGGRKSL